MGEGAAACRWRRATRPRTCSAISRRRTGIALRRRGPVAARLLTAVETLDMAAALVRARDAPIRTNKGRSIVQDYKLGFRMLVKYPGLTLAGGLALAIAIGIGAGWYDLSGDLLRPTLPLPEGDRIVEVEMRDSAASEDERRLLHDFVIWRRDARSDRGSRRVPDARAEPDSRRRAAGAGDRRGDDGVGVPRRSRAAAPRPPAARRRRTTGRPAGRRARLRRVAAALRRTRTTSIGRTMQLGSAATTVVGVMPEGFAFPVNHRLWVPLQLRPSGYAPLEGAGGPRVRAAGAGRDAGASLRGGHRAGRTRRRRPLPRRTSICVRASWHMEASLPAIGRGSSSR